MVLKLTFDQSDKEMLRVRSASEAFTNDIPDKVFLLLRFFNVIDALYDSLD
jgi:hypothetical protein